MQERFESFTNLFDVSKIKKKKGDKLICSFKLNPDLKKKIKIFFISILLHFYPKINAVELFFFFFNWQCVNLISVPKQW